MIQGIRSIGDAVSQEYLGLTEVRVQLYFQSHLFFLFHGKVFKNDYNKNKKQRQRRRHQHQNKTKTESKHVYSTIRHA